MTSNKLEKMKKNSLEKRKEHITLMQSEIRELTHRKEGLIKDLQDMCTHDEKITWFGETRCALCEKIVEVEN